jgi:AsmA protein
MKRVLKKTLKYLSITFFVLIILVVSIPLFFKSQIRTKVIAEIDKNISADVNFSDISFSSFRHFPHLSIALENVSVVGVDEFKGDTLAAASEISVTLNLFTLLKGNNLEVNNIDLEDPVIEARILPNGKANYTIVKPDTSTVKKTKSNFEIAIDSWSINNGRLIYDDKLQKTYIEVGGLYHKGSGDFKSEISDLDITAKVSDLTLMYNGIRYFDKKLFKADLNMEMNLKEKKFTFKDHEFQLGHFKFGFDGYFKLLDNGYETDLTFAVEETDFKNLLSLLPGIYQKDMDGIETKGEFSCNGFVKGVYDVKDNKMPAYHVDLKVFDAMFKYSHLPKAIENIDFDLVADNPDGNPEHTSLDLKTFHFEIEKEPVHGSISITGMENMKILADIKVKATLSELENIYPVKGLILKGNITSEININGVYNLKSKKLPAYHIDLKVNDGYVKYSHLPKAIEKINFDLIADNPDSNMEHSVFNLKTFHFELDKEPVHGNIHVKGIKDMYVNADIKLKADLAQLEKMYPIDSLILKGILTSEIKIDGRYNDSLKLFPKVDAFMVLEKGFVKQVGSPLEMDSIHINAELINEDGKVTDTRINLNNMTFLLDDEPFVMSGTISDLKKLEYKLKIDGLLDLDKLTRIYPVPDSKVKGTMDFDMITEGSLAKIEAKQFTQLKSAGTLEMKNVSFKSTDIAFPIHIDDALFTFDADKIILSRFKAEFGKSNVALSGHLYNYIPYLLKNNAPIKGDLTMLCDTIDMNEWFPASVSTSTVQTKKADTTREVLVISDNMDFTIESDIKLLKFGGMNISHLTGEIRIKNSVCTLNETGFNALDSKFVMSGDYDSRDAKHPMFDFKIDVDKLDINKAYKMFVDPKATPPASGNFSTKYAVKGELAPDFMPIYSTLTGGGKIVIDSVSIKGMKIMNHLKNVSKKDEFKDPTLNDVTIVTEIKGGKIYLSPFTFKASKYLAEVEGWQGFDERMEYFIKVSVLPLSLVKIPISISGHADKPVIKMGKGFTNADLEGLQ